MFDRFNKTFEVLKTSKVYQPIRPITNKSIIMSHSISIVNKFCLVEVLNLTCPSLKMRGNCLIYCPDLSGLGLIN